MILRTLALCSALACVPACVVVTPTPQPGPVVIGTGGSRPVGAPVSQIAVGAGAPDLGYDGYIITASAGSYRITWSGAQNFTGSVWIATGTAQFIAGCSDGSCGLDSSEDQVVLNGQDPSRIDFGSLPVSGKRSGFDLMNTGDIILDLEVNGVPDPSRVEFVSAQTGQLATAPAMPFQLTM